MKLTPHADTPPLGPTSIEAECWHAAGRWRFRYRVEGVARLVLPGPSASARTNGLWRTTCFEAFVGGKGASYREYNFAPSGQWAAYGFDGPREGMRDAPDEVEVRLERGEDWIAVEAAVLGDLVPGSPLNLTAVIEEEDGRKSYWALAHAAGPPDFHNRDCFAASLPPLVTP